MVNIYIDSFLLVSADKVITALIPYSFKIAAFCAPNTFPRKSPPNYYVSGKMQLIFYTMGFLVSLFFIIYIQIQNYYKKINFILV